jgi:hypothetical protein
MKVTKLATRAHTPAAMMMAWPNRWPVPPSTKAGCTSWTMPAAMAETGADRQCSAVQCNAMLLLVLVLKLLRIAGGEMEGGRWRGLQISSQSMGSGALNGRRRPWRATAHRLRALRCVAVWLSVVVVVCGCLLHALRASAQPVERSKLRCRHTQ